MPQTRRNVLFTLLIALVMGAVVWGLSLGFVGAPKIVRPMYLSGLLGAAILLYFGLGYVFKTYTLTELKSWLKRRKKNGTNGAENGRQ